MAEIRIPSSLRPGLIALASASNQGLAELTQLLETHPEVLTSRESAFELASSLTQLRPDDGFAILEAVIPLLYLKASASEPSEKIVKAIVNTLLTGKKDDQKLPRESVARLSQHLAVLLDLSRAALKAKALSLATDGQRTLSTTRIISDIRPVFGDDPSKAPLAVIILHSLRITFAESGEEREFFVHLDSADLKDLQDCIARAVNKEATLKRFLETSRLPVIDTSR